MNLTILIDSREQLPLAFGDIATERATLRTGDYSVVADGADLRDQVAVERKSLPDLLGCIGQQRPRFERELERLAQIRFRALVIEATLAQVVTGTRYSTLHPHAVLGSLFAWSLKYGVAPIFAGDRNGAALVVASLLRHAARYAQGNPENPLPLPEQPFAT